MEWDKFKNILNLPKSKRETISYKDIASLFDPKVWDVSILTPLEFLRVTNAPIKVSLNKFGTDFTNGGMVEEELFPVIMLAQKSWSWDYSHYNEAQEIFNNSKFPNWTSIYLNFKEAAILSGLGVRAMNSLVYNYKFGFDCHYCAIGLAYDVVDMPTDRRINTKMWNRCHGCDDCANACPVKAINNKEKPYWLNTRVCDNMIGLGIPSRPDIPSVKTFWNEHIYPEFAAEDLEDITDYGKLEELTGSKGFKFNRNGYSFDGEVVRDRDDDAVSVPLCRECTSQPRCSKWNGKFPYDKFVGKIKNFETELAENSTYNKNKRDN